MRAMNMCYSTVTTTSFIKSRPDYKEGVDFEYVYDYKFDENKNLIESKNDDTIVFMKPNKCKGILPNILTCLLDERKKVKKTMKTEKNNFQYKLLDAKQLALKVVANSIYGATSTSKGSLVYKDIGASVTRYGRGLIMKTQDICEKKFNVQVVYGDTDSVFIKMKEYLWSKWMKKHLKLQITSQNNLSTLLSWNMKKYIYLYYLQTRKNIVV